MTVQGLLGRETRILVVDDVKSERVAVKCALAELGYHNIVEATTGREALTQLEHDPAIGLVISDWQMPDMEGIEMARFLLQEERWAALPLIMVTAKGERENLIEATFTGVWGYVVKPVTTTGLAEEIENARVELSEMANRNEP